MSELLLTQIQARRLAAELGVGMAGAQRAMHARSPAKPPLAQQRYIPSDSSFDESSSRSPHKGSTTAAYTDRLAAPPSPSYGGTPTNVEVAKMRERLRHLEGVIEMKGNSPIASRKFMGYGYRPAPDGERSTNSDGGDIYVNDPPSRGGTCDASQRGGACVRI
mmetsp:Transcript_10637/g.26098  ORF Transcript_10637/g.26098 Transcript_10637/m.26098 type:complete len:163 (-) Transcript_10637:51-539(-)